MNGRAAAPPTLPVPVLRAAVQREVDRSSLRQAAREIGLSPNGLRNFLIGAAPRTSTRIRLERWLTRRGAGEARPSVKHLVRLLDELAVDLSAEQAAALAQGVSDFLLDAYQSRQLPPPRWVRELARHYRQQPPRG